jgi:molybdate transport system substrate-binding protein
MVSGVTARSDVAAKKTRTLQVAAASDLEYALGEIVREFQQQHPDISVRVAYGSSGNFFAALRNQAPFDVYFSADIAYPDMLLAEGMAVQGSRFAYAHGRLVLWAPRSSNLDLQGLGLAVLRQPTVRHIAIANPRHAPYGKAAEAALRSAGIYDEVQGKLVLGENVAQAFQFVQSGAADVGIIALSLALAPAVAGQGQYREVAQSSYPAVQQGGVILKWAKDTEAAWDLRAFVMGPRGRALLHQFGFKTPGE